MMNKTLLAFVIGACFSALCVISLPDRVMAQSDEVDPTDPTNVVASVSGSFEHVEFDNGQGNSQTYAVEAWIPLSPRDLLTVEARIVDPNLSGNPSDTVFGGGLLFSDLGEASGAPGPADFGDIRLRYFHLISVEGAGALRAWAPSLDLRLPTGDPDKATGGDYWIVSPNVVLAFDLAESVSLYTFVRYVQGIPTRDQPEINAFNLETPVSFTLGETTFLTLTPNFFHDFGETDTTFLTGKVGLTQMFSETLGTTVEGTLPIAGDTGTDFGVKVSLFLFL